MGARFWRRLAIEAAGNVLIVFVGFALLWLTVRFLCWNWISPTWGQFRLALVVVVIATVCDARLILKGR